MTTHTTEKLFSCPRCNRQYKRQDSVDRHVKKAHQKVGAFMEKYKASKVKNSGEIKEEFKWETAEEAKGDTLREIKVEVNSEITEETEESVDRSIAKSDHCKPLPLKGPNSNKSKRFSCDVCSKLFHSNAHLIRHMGTHTKEKLWACFLCDKFFKRQDSVDRHVKRVHFKDKFKAVPRSKVKNSGEIKEEIEWETIGEVREETLGEIKVETNSEII